MTYVQMLTMLAGKFANDGADGDIHIELSDRAYDRVLGEVSSMTKYVDREVVAFPATPITIETPVGRVLVSRHKPAFAEAIDKKLETLQQNMLDIYGVKVTP